MHRRSSWTFWELLAYRIIIRELDIFHLSNNNKRRAHRLHMFSYSLSPK